MTIQGRIDTAKGALLNGSQERVNLGGCALKDQGAEEVASLLKKNQRVKSLNLANNQIGADGGLAFAKALEVNHSVQEIFLEGNDLGQEAKRSISAALYRNRQLKERGEVLQEWDLQGEVEKVIRYIGKLRGQAPFFKSDEALARFFNCQNASKRLGVSSSSSSSSASSSSHVAAIDKNLSPLEQAALVGDLEKVQELAENKGTLLEGDQKETLIQKIKKRVAELAKQGNQEDIEKLLEVRDFLQETLDDLLVNAEEEKREDLAKQAVQAGARLNLLETSETFLKKEVEVTQKELIALLKKLTISDDREVLEKLANLLEAQITLKGIDLSSYLRSLVSQGKLEGLKLLVSFGASVNLSYEKGNTLLHLAFAMDQQEVARFLVASGARIDARNDQGKTPLELSPKKEGEGLSKELSALKAQVAADFRAYENRLDTHQALIGELQEIVDVRLRRKIEGFLKSQYGAYYKAFYTTFTSKMTSEFIGLRASLSNWVSGSDTTSQKAMKQIPKFIKPLVPVPGASLAANLFLSIPLKLTGGIKSGMLSSLAKVYPKNEDVDHFVSATACYLMELFEKQLILFDQQDKRQGYQVNQEAMSALSTSLSSRLFAFMFSDHFYKEKNLFPLDRKEMDKRAKTLALSVTWFNPNLFFKLEYYEKLPFINDVIISLPTEKTLSLLQKGAQKRRAAANLLGGFMNMKVDTKGFKGAQKGFTDRGLFQRSPYLIEGKHFGNRDCRPKDYPPLSLSSTEQSYIEAQVKRKKGFIKPIAVPRRQTLSYRELYERVNKSQSSSSSSSSSSMNQGTIFVGAGLNEVREKSQKMAEFAKKKIEREIRKLNRPTSTPNRYDKEDLMDEIDDLDDLNEFSSQVIEDLRKQVEAIQIQ
ncbi:ankyrin repeat domain-containing protein [Candidatus Neptunochlamydia vexilliferae]|uniref:Uncharacterized protein n=1 Tax=Candidatus Neptunichlamydia vexilliferae TaxID=1651774 RepID=A0ABS0AZ66_9BACT|nr:ankyrin repeat domain-containing protein [Candidatus Neptunochlamydia vexilliferae]MBF5059418.1 hypothetical protein [Candidatus Neptunochlamydia vexilliferae]